MSEYKHHNNDDLPRFEPWLAMMLCSFLPAALVLLLPSLIVPLIAMTVVLFAAGLAMFRRTNAATSADREVS